MEGGISRKSLDQQEQHRTFVRRTSSIARKGQALKKKKAEQKLKWRWHDTYDPSFSMARIVTRSQSPFYRMAKNYENLELMGNFKRHEPPNTPHLMPVLKGPLGSLPRTVITRMMTQTYKDAEPIDRLLKPYLDFDPGDPDSYIKKYGKTLDRPGMDYRETMNPKATTCMPCFGARKVEPDDD